MLNTYDLTQQEVAQVLHSIPTYFKDGICLPVFILHYEKAQHLIDLHMQVKNSIPNLLPVQFYYLLGKTGLDKALNQFLDNLHAVDVEKYAMYKAYLSGARFYEFSKALAMYTEIKPHLLAINGQLDFTEAQLKVIWKESSQI